MPKFIFKANDDVISHCSCENEPAMSEGQFDCPWCGCGWMIACSKCTRSFVYAEVRWTDVPLEELGRREVAARGLKGITDEMIRNWAEDRALDMEPFEIGQKVIYLDGHYFPIDACHVKFRGFHAHHDFKRLPHFDALASPGKLRETLGDPGYWHAREREERNRG